MFPGLPTCHIGGVVIEPTIDEECQAHVVTKDGQPFGAWLDDSTPNLAHWLNLAVTKYGPLAQPVFVCVPPGQPLLHHTRPSPAVIVNVYEAYWYGFGVPPSDWLPLPKFSAYICQWRYPGTHGKRPPTVAQRDRLLSAVLERHPTYLFLF